jgi:hypothetical protein
MNSSGSRFGTKRFFSLTRDPESSATSSLLETKSGMPQLNRLVRERKRSSSAPSSTVHPTLLHVMGLNSAHDPRVGHRAISRLGRNALSKSVSMMQQTSLRIKRFLDCTLSEISLTAHSTPRLVMGAKRPIWIRPPSRGNVSLFVSPGPGRHLRFIQRGR